MVGLDSGDSISRGEELYRKGQHPDPEEALLDLERLFADPDLIALRAKEPAHPAVVQHAIVSLFVGRDTSSARFGEALEIDLFDAAGLFLELLVDHQIWNASEDFWKLLEDAEIRQFLTTRLPKPEMYRDVLVELTYWASLRSKGYQASLQEADGLPDLKVETDGAKTWVEAKHIRLGTSPSRLKKLVEKANRQIKSAEPEVAGLVYVHLSRYGQRAERVEGVPNDVQQFVDEARKALSGASFGRIGKIVLSWDKTWMPIRPVAAEEPKYVMAAARHSMVIEHSKPLLPSALPNSDAKVLNTAIIAFDAKSPRGELPPYITHDVEVSDLLRSTTERSQGLTPLHLVDIVRDPSEMHRHAIDGGGDEFLLATRLFESEGSRSEVVLVEGIKLRDQRVTLLGAFRLFGRHDQLVEWSSDPTSCFEALLEQFGVPVGAPGIDSQLIHKSLQVPSSDAGAVGFGVDRQISDDDRLVFLGIFRRTAEFLQVHWLHAIDLREYERSLDRNLRT